jgi:hypothetical protein
VGSDGVTLLKKYSGQTVKLLLKAWLLRERRLLCSAT